MLDWHVWMVAGLALVISEMFSGDFWLTCLAIGCGAAAAVGLLTPLGLTAQVATFAVTTIVSLVAVRPSLLRHFQVGKDVIRTNVHALPGKTGTVIEAVAAGAGGRVVVEGEDWRCAALDGGAIEQGAKVMIVHVDGNVLLVEKEL